ncbi:MAG: glycogen/starch/alpha-glucan phosphorylase [Rhizobiales bacterium]|nr:glycogen/starch/alpha-glucan phosphorylase [Hyphomicrobiales bacterium]
MSSRYPLPALPQATPRALADEILKALTLEFGKDPAAAQERDWLQATILAIRNRVVHRWLDSMRESRAAKEKRVYYLSAEFLIGRLLRDAVSNLGLLTAVREALDLLGQEKDLLAQLEPDAALGNGGLGRLAACFMESMASLGIPAFGYGIRYQFGLFRQKIEAGMQVEEPEDWLARGNPWELVRNERTYQIGFGGGVETTEKPDGTIVHTWLPAETLLATAHDTPVCGWRGRRVNTLRLWHAHAVEPLKLGVFNGGDHMGAQHDSIRANSINQVLYPSDSNPAGHELRLRQEYFFTSASLQDILRRHTAEYGTVRNLAEKAAIQLNDTHPAIAVAELMRLLVDVHCIEWDEAWEITRATVGYTNHTLLPEALESWPVDLFEGLLPRHMQIIYQINASIIADAHEQALTDFGFLESISIIDERNGKRVRMGQLAFCGAHSVNGVSALHSDLMKQTVFRDLNTLYPGRINNKTNGVTPRRWLQQVNPGLTGLIRDAIGEGFLDDAEKLKDMDRFASDAAFREKFAGVKRANKVRLAQLIHERTGLTVDASALFDVQIKRIHEYKRQLLAILETIALYDAIRAHPDGNWVPRVKLFAGKAAASYWEAKTIIRLINDVGAVVNADKSIKGLLKVVFMPNYNVSLAEAIVPAADISEQISTAGMEASGTGNMKLALNGALTVGTLDGANVEILEHAGKDNVFIFGLTAEEVAEKRSGGYDPREVIERSPHLQRAFEAMRSGQFSPGETGRYHGLIDKLIHFDYFMVMADFAAYSQALNTADKVWQKPAEWTAKSIHNTARLGWFSADRTIREYARDIWNVPAG